VAKVFINGEAFEWDSSRSPMSEALAIERALNMRYVDWQTELGAGSARALAGFYWLVWRRNGRDVPWADIESGDVEIDRATSYVEGDASDEDEDPTGAPEEAPQPPDPSQPTLEST
jgi:hypothetical protein